MEIRERIIKLLDNHPFIHSSGSEYEKLKQCLIPYYPEAQEINNSRLYQWLKGVIQSLFYKPNMYCLVLEGNKGIGKTRFFYDILPDELKDLYTERKFDYYSNLISCNQEFFHDSSAKKLVTNTGYIVYHYNIQNLKEPSINMRLVSYCGTTNEFKGSLNSRRFLVIKLEDINKELYNSINKLELWRELFFMFKNK